MPEGAADGVTVPLASSGAGALGDDRIIEGGEAVDTKQHLAMLWMFIAFLIGTALKYILAVRTRETKLLAGSGGHESISAGAM
jgi:hypothetical protein